MNTGGETAEQIVRMSFEGFQVAAKISGEGAKNIANYERKHKVLYVAERGKQNY